MNLGEKIRSLRKKQKLSQKQLANKVGCDDSFISKLENNSIESSIKSLEKIANALHVPIAYLLTPQHEWYQMLPPQLQNFVKEENIEFLEVGLKAKENGWTPQAIKEVIDTLSKNLPKEDN